jgi:hypothetical protein
MEPASDKRPWLWGLFVRPEMKILTVLSLLVGVVVGVFVLPEQWSLGMRVMAGVALGLTMVITLFANRMIGGEDF